MRATMAERCSLFSSSFSPAPDSKIWVSCPCAIGDPLAEFNLGLHRILGGLDCAFLARAQGLPSLHRPKPAWPLASKFACAASRTWRAFSISASSAARRPARSPLGGSRRRLRRVACAIRYCAHPARHAPCLQSLLHSALHRAALSPARRLSWRALDRSVPSARVMAILRQWLGDLQFERHDGVLQVIDALDRQVSSDCPALRARSPRPRCAGGRGAVPLRDRSRQARAISARGHRAVPATSRIAGA